MAKNPEILAPVGGMEHLIAAVRSGANAVYFGLKNFNARRNAQNFDDESLSEAVSYCHVRGVKVYLTLNTLILDKEAKALTDEIYLLAKCAIDGLIVQDLGVARFARQICPSLPLHASTQMTIHNVSGAKALEELGFSRVVLARELSASEIELIAKSTGLELEVFVHGALCMSVSGQCYLSSMLGGRSGNRGLCAQPCRLNFNSDGREYALSLKDLSLIQSMDKLKGLGISALKIEGRMKRPEYVAAAVTACRAALEGKEADMDTLRAVFSRSGFTDGYFRAQRDIRMFGNRTKEDVIAATPVLEKIASAYRNEQPLIPIDMKLNLQKDTPALLEVSDGAHTIRTAGAVPQEAIKLSLDAGMAHRSLSKTGGTPFYLNRLSTELESGLTLPLSAINQMRKAALENLETERGRLIPRPCQEIDLSMQSPLRRGKTPELRIRLRQMAQISDKLMEKATKVILPVEDIYAHKEVITTLKQKLVGELPLMIFPQSENKLRDTLRELKIFGLSEVIAGNLGTLTMARELGFIVHGDYSLNILNSYALQTIRDMGVADQTLSFEIGMREAAQIFPTLPYGIIGYGYLPLMTFRNCPAKNEKGCLNCGGHASIADRMNQNFPIVCRNHEYSQLFNMLPLYLSDKQEQTANFDFITLYFTIEDQETCQTVMRQYLEHTAPADQYTRGLYFRTLQ